MPEALLQRCTSFVPKAETQVLWPTHKPHTPRPTGIPLLRGDFENEKIPIDVYSDAYFQDWPLAERNGAPSPIPQEPEPPTSLYSYPILTKNERLRLTLLWYYTRGFDSDEALLGRLQDKVRLVQEIIGWDMVITGIIDNEKYTSLATIGLPIATYPRRESACAHTINNRGHSLIIPDTQLDWRFRQAPHFKLGGLRAYAGAPLQVDTEFGEKVSLGSLCVVSQSPQDTLSATQHAALTGFAELIAAEIVHACKLRRQRNRSEMTELVTALQEKLQEVDAENLIMDVVQKQYPHAKISLQTSSTSEISLEDREPISFSDIEGGIWEDTDYFESQILQNNQAPFRSTRTVRVITSRCMHLSTPTYLVVASNQLEYVFDDVDAWFVERCAIALSTVRQERNLQKALKAKDLFLRGMTHQLRTPIHGVLGATELLAEELKSHRLAAKPVSPATPTPTFDASPYIRTIRTSGRDLMSIVDSMLKLNRLDDVSHQPGQATVADLREMETDVMNNILQTAHDDYMEHVFVFFHNEIPSECANLMIDVNLLRDCLQHLVMNAIQNTTDGNVTIKLYPSHDKKSLLVDVVDSGCGIASDDRTRIFEAFEKVDTHSRGVGLGLTLATRLAAVMGGTVTLLSSEPNEGSHFQMQFVNINFTPSAVPELPFREQFLHLPTSFTLDPAPSSSDSVSTHMADYLKNHGYEQVDDISSTLKIVDCSSDTNRLTDVLNGLDASQVAIYVVPAGATAEQLQQTTDKRNIVSLAGPFTSINLYNALQKANEILSIHIQNQDKVAVIDLANKTLSPLAVTTSALERNSHLRHCVSHLPLQRSIKSSPIIETNSINDTLSPLTTSISPTTSNSPAPPSETPLALLVDDNAINLQIMVMYCKKRRIPFLSASDGAQAFQAYLHPSFASPHAAHRVNLVLMDLQMPVRDGIAATKDIRALEEERGWARSVIFMVTGQDSPLDRVRAAEAGADAFLVKPVSMKTLDRALGAMFPKFEVKR